MVPPSVWVGLSECRTVCRAFDLDGIKGKTVEMLLLRKRSKEKGRATLGRLPVYRVRGRKYGPVIEERVLKKTADIAIFGPHSAGKSRWLAKLHGGAAEVWIGRPAAMVRAVDPLGQWTEQPAVEAWHDGKGPTRPWAKLKAHERVEALLGWTEDMRAVILVDDMHRMTGRKADVVLKLVAVAHVVVYTASEEARIPMSLRLTLAKRQPQVLALSSDAAYDYTGALTWALCILAAAMGAWPIAAAVGGLKVLARGKRAAKQS
jgi:hypothetical protein